MDLKALKDSTSAAAAEGKKLVLDPVDSRSPVAAAIRANLDHSTDLIAIHENWLKANPAPAPATPVVNKSTPAPTPPAGK